MTPPVGGILETSLYVEDLGRSVAFYGRLFGFTQIAADADRLRALAVPGRGVLLIFKRGGSPDHDGAGRLHLAFPIATDDLVAWERWLDANGVVVEERKTWPLGGTSLDFRDPDNNLLEVATPGVWSNY